LIFSSKSRYYSGTFSNVFLHRC